MTDLSEKAKDLLKTLKRIKKINTMAGEFVDKRRILIEYGYDQNSHQLDEEFNELKDAGYIKKESGAYRLLAKALNWQPISPSAKDITIYSGVYGSNISHMSSSVSQKLEIESLDESIRTQIDQLIEATEKKDSSRVKTIIDGLLISSPAILLQILSIGLGLGSKK